ncbi:Crp/Fnr family transcriptional regulator [Aestuariibaculum sediminum]|uniref:Crp/Fnr family transcriptional regulator n=1 Tax=Aestuariibaculum sediminum TaxID=2770637 RepID=A0A8J6QHE0_9FLAO|nr:Crp/Fnr family transcriptional regulator [Aestuariibaculum sediminum]MBD0831879.1 Crp/Fnr family transcriptional regulator [Aestuariibaculum sediminum]
MTSTFKTFIEHYVSLPEEDWNKISAVFEKVVYKKNESIFSEGEVCNYLFFLEEGLLRNFMKHNNQEITKFFIPAPYCVTSRMSFINKTVTKENIQALEKCILWRVTLDQYNELMTLDSWRLFTRKMLNEVQDFTEERLITNMTETAESRYYNLVKENSALVNRIPKKYLASYLGIATQSLSRIRKNAPKK